MKYSIYDELTKSWLLCKYSEEQYFVACEAAQQMNAAHNKKLSEYKQMRRYSVKAIEEKEVEANV